MRASGHPSSLRLPLDTLSVYKAPLGGIILSYILFIQMVSIGIASFILMWMHSQAIKTASDRHRKYYHLFFGLLIFAAFFIGFSWLIDTSLGIDILFSWVMNKSGYDLLNLQYLGDWIITFTIIIYEKEEVNVRGYVDREGYDMEVLEVGNVMDAYKIFSTLRERGKPSLSPTSEDHSSNPPVIYQRGF